MGDAGGHRQGTALGATQLNATASVPGTFVYAPAAGTVLAAGTQTLGVTFTPTDTARYTTATASTTLVVTVPRTTPTVSWATPAAITQGTALGATQLNATASVPGTFVYAPAAGTVLAAGTHTLGRHLHADRRNALHHGDRLDHAGRHRAAHHTDGVVGDAGRHHAGHRAQRDAAERHRQRAW